jgi:hypothetical protein
MLTTAALCHLFRLHWMLRAFACRTPFRFTFEEAKKDGEEVMKQVENRLAQQLEAGRKATHVPEPQFGPSSTTDGSKQGKLLW